jgi:mono/diheme cytochrome c family protein
MKKNLVLSVAVLFMAAFSLTSFKVAQEQPEPWPVPEEYKNMENPVEADAESLQIGKMLYNKNCASCHGKKGLGDGPKARMLDTFSGDFSGDYYQDQTDGEHFYKTKEGRGEMPGYGKKMSDEDIWHMVNYMRTFDK